MTEGIQFICSYYCYLLLPIKKEKVRLWGKPPAHFVYIEVGGIKQSVLNVGKQSQKWKRSRPESAAGLLLVAQVFTSKWWLKSFQNCNRMIICLSPCNRGIITDDLAPFNMPWHGACCSDLPHTAVFPSIGVQLSCFLSAFSTTQSHPISTYTEAAPAQSKQEW